jgi:predicted O-methyltransferase YrrM
MDNPALKLKVFVGFPSYGGNGGISSEVPDIREWWVETVLAMKGDPRIADVAHRTLADTPITMVRNDFVRLAKDNGCHLLLMVDSDQSPNKHAQEPWFKPFWDEAFTFMYDNYGKGPRLVFAPYVGPQENVYVFQWQDRGNKGLHSDFALEPYSRQHAAMMSGIQEAAAGPTGMILIDLRLCDLVAPSGLPQLEVLERLQTGQMTVQEAQWALHEGYFHYEWETSYANKKASTEDVTFTRNVSLAGLEKLGYNPVYCAWDSWIGHHKPVNVGRPQRYTAEQVHATFQKAVLENGRANEVIIDLDRLNNPFSAQAAGLPSARHSFAEIQGADAENHQGNGHDATTPTGRVTRGDWHAHGHAPAEHCAALADLVRSHSYRLNRPLRILEVGTWLGTTAMAMADALREVRVHCVDTWEGTPSDCTGRMAEMAGGAENVHAEFLRRIGDRLDKTIFPWRKSSAEAAAMSWPGGFDLIFIDAEHTYEALKAQILEWWLHLNDDGVMCGHDLHVHGYDGVGQAVRELFGESYTAFGFHPQGCLWRVSKADHLDSEKLNGCQLSAR